MGIPKFYRWLSERYPLCNQPCDLAGAPEIDNLYLDMNGIIHNCTHANDPSLKLTQNEMVLRIFMYLEKIVAIAKPQNLLFMAIDGVAPRAKMNQQRSRRFRSSKERLESIAAMQRRGENVDPENMFDSNCITPGTEFMQQLGEHLKFFIRKKMSEGDRYWTQPQIVLSCHDVPGEGEHKIMQYIRHQKFIGDWQPNLRHCMYGLDADLIMLSLVTHEPHFLLLREMVQYGGSSRGQPSRTALENPSESTFILFRINLLREYLHLEFKGLDSEDEQHTNEQPSEKIVDDFVLFCMLVGNDFLPALPTLDIGEGALNLIFSIYKQVRPQMGGYIIQDGRINRQRFQMLVSELACMEASTLEQRAADAEYMQSKKQNQRDADIFNELDDIDFIEQRMLELAGNLPAQDRPKRVINEGATMMNKQAREMFLAGDKVSGLQQWKNRYYKEKLDMSSASDIRQVVKHYLQGLDWVMDYYYRGVTSWDWYYPYHYAPMTQDLTDVSQLEVKDFLAHQSEPFLPFLQLLSVLPAASAKLLPALYRPLMLQPTSPIIDFYPQEFQVDQEGKRNDWEGVVLIPFVDESRLLAAVDMIQNDLHSPKLSVQEMARNQHGKIHVFHFNPSSQEQTYCKSTHPELPDVVHPRSSVADFIPDLHVDPNSTFQACLFPGTQVGRGNPKGYPAFNSIDGEVTAELREIGCTVFQQPSRNESLVVILPNLDQQLFLQNLENNSFNLDSTSTVDNLLKILGTSGEQNSMGNEKQSGSSFNHNVTTYGSNNFDNYNYGGDNGGVDFVGGQIGDCWVEWPFMKEGRVCKELNIGEFEFDVEATIAKNYWLKNKGVDVGDIQKIVYVQKLETRRFTQDGTLEKQYSAEAVGVPGHLVFYQNDMQNKLPNEFNYNEDRYGGDMYIPEIEIGQYAIYLGRTYFGCKCQVLDICPVFPRKDEDYDEYEITKAFLIALEPPSSQVGTIVKQVRRVVSQSGVSEQYFSAQQVAARLGISSRCLGRITGNVWATVGKNKYDVGLAVKSGGKNLCVPDYTLPEPEGNGWRYSVKMVGVLSLYQRRFQWIFKWLEEDEGGGDIEMSQIFSNMNEDEQFRLLSQVLQFIKELPNAKRKLVKATSEVLPESSIHSLYQILSGHKEPVAAIFQDAVVPQQLLGSFRAGDTLSVLVGGETNLGDRVVHVCEGQDVPFGITGTVVGVYEGVCEVLFDWEFPGGTDLQGRSMLRCGGMVLRDHLFNLTAQKQNAVYSPTKPRQLKFHQVISKYPNCASLAQSWAPLESILQSSYISNQLQPPPAATNGHQDLSVISLLQDLGITQQTPAYIQQPQALSAAALNQPHYSSSQQFNLQEELKNYRQRSDLNILLDQQLNLNNNTVSRMFNFGDPNQFKKWEPKSEDDKKTQRYQNQKHRIQELLSELQQQSHSQKVQQQSSNIQQAEILSKLKQLQMIKAQQKQQRGDTAKETVMDNPRNSSVAVQPQAQAQQQQQSATSQIDQVLSWIDKKPSSSAKIGTSAEEKKLQTAATNSNYIGRQDSDEDFDIENFWNDLKTQYIKEREEKRKLDDDDEDEDDEVDLNPLPTPIFASVDKKSTSQVQSAVPDFMDFWQNLKK